ncbi:MAG TPA: hypothetical protein VE136_14595 [Anaerolineales bacterium]|nr:hypothetical protein [Anaerolineales bacterium]
MLENFPRHLVWSTDRLDLTDPFQRRWLLRQILTHGKEQDIRDLDLGEVERELDHLDLPPDIDNLWRRILGVRNANR